MARAFLNPQIKIDQRKQKSEARLYAALVENYHQGTTFDRIEISQLCEQAGVSRATFYRHHEALSDVILVQFLIMISEFQQQIDDLKQVDFNSGSTVVVNVIYEHLELFKVLHWSKLESQVAPLITGAVQQILRLRDYAQTEQIFISQFVGVAVLNFAEQVALDSTPVNKTIALKLFRLLIPERLE